MIFDFERLLLVVVDSVRGASRKMHCCTAAHQASQARNCKQRRVAPEAPPQTFLSSAVYL